MGKTNSLMQGVLNAGVWATALRLLDRGLAFARKIILARLLSPHDFGLFGIILVTLSAIENFSQTGFQQALIQRRGDVKPYLDAAWTIQVFRGVVLAGVVYSAAPLVSTFFGEPRATSMLRVVAISVLTVNFTSIAVIQFQKDLNFKKQFVYMAGGTFVNFFVSVALALLLRNAWALVLGLVAGSVSQALLSYLLDPYRPALTRNIGPARDLFAFGRWVAGSNVSLFLFYNLDNIFVGRVLGTAALGLYQMAYQISNMIGSEMVTVVSSVTFPAYSMIQDEMDRLRSAFLRTVQLVAVASFLPAMLLLSLAPQFTLVFLGKNWVAIAPTIQILALWATIKAVSSNAGPLLHSLGRPSLLTKFLFLRLALLLITVYPFGSRFGVNGVAWAVVLSGAVVDPLLIVFTARLMGIRSTRIIRCVSIPLVAAVAGWGVMEGLQMLFTFDSGIIGLSGLSGIGCTTYIACMFLMDSWLGLGIRSTAVKIVSNALASREQRGGVSP